MDSLHAWIAAQLGVEECRRFRSGEGAGDVSHRVARFATVACAAAIVLSGCASNLDPRTFVGMTVDEVREVAENTTLVLYDISYPVANRASSYEAGANDALWEVVVSCRADVPERGIPLGIVPLSAVTPAIRDEAELGGYDEWLLECPVGG
jgi:hypothetical protein